ncbi:SDR family oxidoreductase [Saccharopolyspora sp. K220]|uniref:SDR family NAD(P)-dependent oxidoreductase n=1 Tax=Saccharopolyspora soli TaxID=2926618 RepID=UPI001F55DB13|nr:SDR family oxidoreductase [Saccharopolyspora soli]MCI2418319.1 SDR family oxidoreductase [Saccharopolyspora soli]
MSSLRADVFVGKSVLVVGGTSGIGAAVANAFTQHGGEVRVTGVGAVAAELDEAIEVFESDVTRPGSLKSIVDEMDRLDVLVNCAGIIRRGEELEPEAFARVVDVNLTGTMRACAAARELLARSGGCIVNTASMLSYFGGALVPGYSASKGGVVQLTKSLAAGYAADRIRVNAVAPGWIRTPLTEELQSDPEVTARILGRTPLGRWGTPRDVARAVLFLASEEAEFITGTVLPVDGGYLAV